MKSTEGRQKDNGDISFFFNRRCSSVVLIETLVLSTCRATNLAQREFDVLVISTATGEWVSRGGETPAALARIASKCHFLARLAPKFDS
jgi:hypothetical protein